MQGSENRGAHWREKVSAGDAPTPWKGNMVWAERIKLLEPELINLLQVLNINEFVLPWKRVDRILLGNSNKALYIQLMIHHLNKVVELEFTDKVGLLGGNGKAVMSKDFLGIRNIKILNRTAFNADGTYIHTIAWAKVNLPRAQYKTAAKLWMDVGLAESIDGNTYTFNANSSPNSKKRAAADSAAESGKKHAPNPPGVMQPAPNLPSALELMLSSHPAPCVTTALLRLLELSNQCSKVAALRAQATEMLASANLLRANAAELNTSAMAMNANSGRLEQLATSTFAEAARLELMMSSHPAPCVTTALIRFLELSNQRSKVTALRAQVGEMAAAAKLLHANAAESNARVMAMHADLGRMEHLAASTLAEADELERMA